LINSRPLSHYIPEDGTETEILTPSTFLVGQRSCHLTTGHPGEEVQPHKAWRHINTLVDELWVRFLKEILPELQPRDRWYKICGSLAINDMVLIVDPKIPRGLWQMGRVIDVKSSRDNLVRTATVFSGGRTLDYAIVQLIKLFTPGVENDPPHEDPLSRLDALEKVATKIPEGIPAQPRQPIPQFQELKRKVERRIFEQTLARRAQEQPLAEQAEIIQCAHFCLSVRQPILAFEALKAKREHQSLKSETSSDEITSTPNESAPAWCLKTLSSKLQADEEVRQAERALREATEAHDKLDAMCRLHEARRNPMRTRPLRLEPSVKQLKLDMDQEKKRQLSLSNPIPHQEESKASPSTPRSPPLL
jgi:hypothetical protein